MPVVSLPANMVQFDRSITPGATPDPSILKEGSIAINMADKMIFTKDHDGNVISLGMSKEYIDAGDASTLQAAQNYSDAAIAAVKGGALAVEYDTLVKIASQIEQNKSDIASVGGSMSDYVLQTDYNTFIARTDNPHGVTKDQVGLGLVSNFEVTDSATEGLNTKYASGLAVKAANDRAVTAESNAAAYTDGAISDLRTELLGGTPDAALDTLLELGTAIQENDGEIAGINAAIGERAKIVDVDAALALKADITYVDGELANKLDTATYAAFIARTDNPHAVTKAQVGLDLVQNYGISDSVILDQSDMYASSKAVFLANARAEAAETNAATYTDTQMTAFAQSFDFGRTF